MGKEQYISVYDTAGRYLSRCSKKRADRLVYRQKASWLGEDKITLLITKKDERIIKEQVLRRDGPICYICGDHLPEDEITYDHIVARSKGGTNFADNLAICCRPCNGDKADRSYVEYALFLYQQIKRYN